MRILFLDDDEQRHSFARQQFIGHEAHHVRTAAEAIDALSKNLIGFDVAMLDHDLGGGVYKPSDETSGFEVAKAMTDGRVPAPGMVLVHSYNPSGAMNMIRQLAGHGVPCAWAPFGPTAFKVALNAHAGIA